MPDDVEPLEGVDGEAVDSGQSGEIESVAGETSQAEAPARRYLEVEDPDQTYVKIRVAGEEVEVPVREALNGYSREADYTRKSQEVAQARAEAQQALVIQEALRTDPERALRWLADMHLPKAQQQQPEVPQFDDPLEERIYHLDQQLQQERALRENRDSDAHLAQTIGGLQQQYGASQEDILQVVQIAAQRQLGIEAIPDIYKALAYDRLVANFRAHQLSQQQTQTEAQQRQAAAAAASQLVSGGQGSTAGVTTASPPTHFKTIREAAEAAMEAAGY